ncbi:MAG TPA: hypothetical protein VET48_10660, partial [Steroidobacteraceae bacterium]|nr:hypothetical protein [Steroidobacteraceae bacterium]
IPTAPTILSAETLGCCLALTLGDARYGDNKARTSPEKDVVSGQLAGQLVRVTFRLCRLVPPA